MIAALIIILACAGLNRARGDDRWMPSWLPGRPLWYVAPAIGSLALLVASWQAALAATAAYLFWGIWPWGRWFDLGRLPDSYARIARPDPFERAIQALAFGSDHLALLFRHVMATPGLMLVGLASGWPQGLQLGLPLVVPVAITAAYELAWRLNPSNPIWLAELATGAIWAGAILA